MRPTSRLRRRIDETFDASDVPRVVAALDALAGLPGPGVGERVQAAIVMLSEGDMERFEQELDLATTDWRDVLMAAGLAGQDWPGHLERYLGPNDRHQEDSAASAPEPRR